MIPVDSFLVNIMGTQICDTSELKVASSHTHLKLALSYLRMFYTLN